MQQIIAQAPAVNGVITIQHIITADDPWGDPWPPDGFCVAIKRARGFTLWRRISLPPTHNAAECVTAFSSAASTKDQ